jgi:molybdopterin molybdotransferase
MPISIYEALNLIEQNSHKVSKATLPIEETIGKISATTIKASLPLPLFDNSAMDGYGCRGDGESFKIIGKIMAGEDREYDLKDGECVRIMTGAKLPPLVDRVYPQEIVEIEGESINVKTKLQIGANLRKRGEDIDTGEVILNEGDRVTAAHIALLASQGMTHMEVYRDVRVAVFASGDELKLHFEKLSNNSELYNSNTPYIIGRVKELGCQARFVGKARDSLEALKELIKNSLEADIIITSGGISVGEADFTKEAFSELGSEIFFEKVDIKPGKPTTFGKIGDTFILNLPGNPFACAVNFEVFAKFAISLLSGSNAPYQSFIETKIAADVVSKKRVDSVVAGYFDGVEFHPKKFFPGSVNTLNRCNGMIIIDRDKDEIKRGDTVKFLPINWSFNKKEKESFITN